MDKQLEFLFKHVYSQQSLEDLAQQYKPFNIKDKNDMQYHLWAREITSKPNIKLAKTLREFKQGIEDLKFGTNFLKNFEKTELIDEELKKYSLKKDVQMAVVYPTQDYLRPADLGGSYRFGDNIFYDSKFNFCLLYQAELIASAGFNPEDKKIQVKQIQGSKKRKKELKPIKWERALLTYICNFAKQNNVPEVEVVSVANNKWARLTFDYLQQNGIYNQEFRIEEASQMSPEEEKEAENKVRKTPKLSYTQIHLMPHHGFMIYDVSAKRCGFKKNLAGNYSRITSSCA